MKNKIEVSLTSNSMKSEKTMRIEEIKKMEEIQEKEALKRKERNIILENLNDYCQTSTLHGMSYLGAKDKSLAEKIWWIIMFMLSVAACTYLITKTWIKWKTSPVILSFEKEQVPIWEVPFPAVTICPLNKVRQTEYNYTEVFRDSVAGTADLSPDEVKKFWDISLVCSLSETLDEEIEFPSAKTFTDEFAVNNIRMVAPSLGYTIMEQSWENKRSDENFLFAEQLTEEGHCFTFNSLSQGDMYTQELNHDIVYINHSIMNKGWTLEDGYSTEMPMDTHPRRSVKDGEIFGLTVTLQTLIPDLDWVCGSPTTGYKIILHNPAEPPKPALNYFLAPLNKKMVLIVRPDVTRTDKDVHSLSVEGRKCFFSDEKTLRFFKIYTQSNCVTECEANITNYFCGCVPFYVPHDKNTRICGFNKTECISEAQNAMLILKTKPSDIHLTNGLKAEIFRDIFLACNCLPACTTLEYLAETSHTDLFMLNPLIASGRLEQFLPPEQMEQFTAGILSFTRVHIFFKVSQFLALQRSELFGQTDFFANCGGLLGLFMGFSLLSGLEIIYFFTIRLWIKFRNRQRNK